MKTLFNILPFILAISLIIASCDTTEPPIIPPPPPVVKDTITVAVESFTHRSVTLNIKTTANSKNSSVRLIRTLNSITTTVAEFSILVKDTTIIDDNNGTGLLLDTTYTYFAVRVDSLGQLKDTSNTVTQKTLAPTSHNYTWQEFTIGDWQSVLYDVWGTDENNVYACGGVTLNDTVYGILHWDGIEWKPFSSTAGGYAIYGFADNDIWVVGGGVWHFNGVIWEEYTYRDPVINNNIAYTSVWGTSSNDLYLGNGGGKIIHWDGSKATVVYSHPQSIQVKDMDGVSIFFIVGVGSGMVPPLLAIVYNGMQWSELPISSNWSLNSVSIVNQNQIYFGGDGIFELDNNNFSQILSPGYYVNSIKYNKKTGVTVASGFFDGVYINNGIEWKSFKGQISNDETTYLGTYLINNTIICVGKNDTQAKIIIGKN